jgi:UDP-N-acetylmuramyl pentapeptide phosphotransferase/UDP-N-acetylglucosamine-1-phosphate transferase
MQIFQYFLITITLFIGILIYFKIADKFNIIDKPNQRSSHNYITIRGGGIVFWLAAMLYCVLNLLSFKNLTGFFAIGITLICAVSFIDDIKSLPNKIRIVIHFISISCVFYGLEIFTIFPVWLIIIAYIIFVGILNAYNFMDGINGITGLYSLAVLVALQIVNYCHCGLDPQSPAHFAPPEFINYAIIACAVFLFFNFRKRAKCFAGDIGSFGIAFWIVTLLIMLMIATNSVIWLMFLAVYGVDTVCTILHRIYLKQNIFEAHRLHFFQILTNEKGLSHRLVAAIYATVQLIICLSVIFVYIYFQNLTIIFSATILVILVLVYLLKFKMMKKTVESIE